MQTRTLDPLALTPTSTSAGLLHLLNASTYQQVSKDDALQSTSNLYYEIYQWTNNFGIASNVSKSSIDYIWHNTLKNLLDPFGYFYLTIKIHKTPVSTRPVCSDCASIVHPLSKWLNYALQPIVKEQHSYFKDLFELKQQLDNLNLPPNASLITFDAVSMYTNIDINN
jgi:hypothetical protein